MAYSNFTPTPASNKFVTESLKPGCPMLIRASAPHPTIPGAILMRCALGWSLHDALDCGRCAETSAVVDCWQVHPELTPVVELPDSAETIEAVPAPHAAD